MEKRDLMKIIDDGLEILYEPNDDITQPNGMRWVKNELNAREINLLLWDVLVPLKRELRELGV